MVIQEYKARSWTGWHRHSTLALVAHAFLDGDRARARRAPKGLARSAGSLVALKHGQALAG